MKLLRGLIVLSVLGFAGPASAEIEFYGAVGLGQSDTGASATDFSNALTAKGYDITSASVDAEDSGWRFLLGLRFTEIFAVEFGYVDLGEVSTAVTGDIATNQTAQFTRDVADALPVMPRGLTLAGVARSTFANMGMGSGPAAEKLSVAIKLGFIDADSERKVTGASGKDEADADPYYGLTFGWDFTDSWRGVLGYEVFNMADSTSYLSAGVEFRFPQKGQ